MLLMNTLISKKIIYTFYATNARIFSLCLFLNFNEFVSLKNDWWEFWLQSIQGFIFAG